MPKLTRTDRKALALGALIVIALMVLGILFNITAPRTMSEIHMSLDEFRQLVDDIASEQ
jgi:hypothetical protein